MPTWWGYSLTLFNVDDGTHKKIGATSDDDPDDVRFSDDGAAVVVDGKTWPIDVAVAGSENLEFE